MGVEKSLKKSLWTWKCFPPAPPYFCLVICHKYYVENSIIQILYYGKLFRINLIFLLKFFLFFHFNTLILALVRPPPLSVWDVRIGRQIIRNKTSFPLFLNLFSCKAISHVSFFSCNFCQISIFVSLLPLWPYSVLLCHGH